MNARASQNKLGYALRVHERRLRAIERHLGLASPPNPLENTPRRPLASESRKEPDRVGAHSVRG
jgi:hypothetical protein